MSKKTETAAPAPATTTAHARVDGLVNAFLSGEKRTLEASVAHLASVAASLSGVAPITDDAWGASWRDRVREMFAAAGLAEGTINKKASNLKTVAQGVTHGVAWEGQAFGAYLAHLQMDPDARKAIGRAETTEGGKGRPAGQGAASAPPAAPSATANPAQYIADGFDDNAKGRKEANALCERLGGAEMAMALMIVCDQSESLAATVHAILPKYEAEFRQFAATLLDGAKAAPNAPRRQRRD